MNYFESVCVYASRCMALAPTRLVAPPTDRGHRPYRNADGRYERAGVGEFPPSPNARFFFGTPRPAPEFSILKLTRLGWCRRVRQAGILP